MVTKDFQTLSLRSLLLAGAAAVAVSSWSVPALAQDDDDEETFVITGSRISRTDVNSENPVTIFSGDELRSNGMQNLGESLRQALSTGSGGFNNSSTLSGGGSSSIDLRNFGANRVLILINGRRVAPFTDSLTNLSGDLSLIPISMVDRVEILRDGASTTYGSDAITGVVNIILRDDFEGLTTSVMGGISTHGDAEQVQVSATMGGNFARGNMIASMEYRTVDNVRNADRDWAIPTITSFGDSTYTNGSFFSPGGTLLSTVGGWPIWCTEPKQFGGDEVTDIFDNAGFDIGGGIGAWSGGWDACPAGRDQWEAGRGAGPERYDWAIRQDILNQQSVFSAAFYGTYDVTDWATAFMEFEASARESNSRLDGNPGSFGTALITQGSVVPYTNPYLDADLAAAMDPANGGAGQAIFAFRPSSTVGVRQNIQETILLRTVVGLTGDDLFGRFSWELSYLWTQNRGNAFTNSVWNVDRWNRIADPDACMADTLCSLALTEAGKGPATTTTSDDALDAIRPGNWAPSEVDYFRQNTVSTTDFETVNWFGLVSGDIVDLPAGPLAFAAGWEFREEQGFNKPDPVTESGESVANGVGTTNGSFNVTEFFGEVNIPLLSGLNDGFLRTESLDVNLQARWFDYSTFGDDTTWKVGVNWQITPDVRFRYSQGTAFRAPDVTESFGGNVTSFDFFTDPCAAPTDATVEANCIADGIANPSSFTQISPQYAVTRGSNPNLGPETADTLSLGLIFTPTFLPGLTATFDWWQIQVESFIGGSSSDSIVDLCYTDSTPGTLDNPNCDLFFRSPIGAINGLVNLPSNLDGAVRTDGLDWRITYFWDQLGGTFTADLQGTYVFENSFFPGEGGANGNGGSITQFESIARLDYERNNYTVTWRTRVVGDMDDPDANGNNVFGYDGPEEHIEHDIRGVYQWNNYSFLVGVNNLFDEEAPFIAGGSFNTDPNTYSAIGRYYFASVTADF